MCEVVGAVQGVNQPDRPSVAHIPALFAHIPVLFARAPVLGDAPGDGGLEHIEEPLVPAALLGQDAVIGESGPQAGDDQLLGGYVGLGDGIDRSLEADVSECGAREPVAHDGTGLVGDGDGGLEDSVVVHR